MEFEAAVNKICAAFVFPKPENATVEAWFECAGNMTLRESAWVVDEFIRRTARITRGVNIGHELAKLRDEFKNNAQAEKFRNQAAAAKGNTGCPHCTRGMPGFVQCEVREGNLTYLQTYRCTCNHDARFAHVPFYTTNQQEAV